MKTTVVLTSQETFVWHSLQEVIPVVEGLWLRSALQGSHEVVLVDVDRFDSPRSLLRDVPQVFRAGNIVLTCSTPRLNSTAAYLRREAGLDFRLFIYLLNLATIACWPLRFWGMEGLLREDDVFVSSCRLDAATLSLTFEDRARVEVIPFTLDDESLADRSRALEDGGAPPLIFVGRLSPQKNLHVLVNALAMGPEVRLEFFGREDNLGSPNMGLEFPNYLAHLRRLATRFGVDDRIVFHGHVPRARLRQILCSTPHVFVSPSVHSDENFGMAAFRSLCLGNPAVLTRWGGHADFADEFPGQVRYIDVSESSQGPAIDATELARALKERLSDCGVTLHDDVPVAYQPAHLADRLRRLAIEEAPKGGGLRYSKLAEGILAARARYFLDSPRGCKIFASYSDPMATPIFRAYGMKPRA
jgi:glycosyltransferase involved in cell wall biosynthesis